MTTPPPRSMSDLDIEWHDPDAHEALGCPRCQGSGYEPDPFTGMQADHRCTVGCPVPESPLGDGAPDPDPDNYDSIPF